MKRLINLKPRKGNSVLLGIVPFLIIVMIYVFASHIRLQENPDDKLLPSITQMAQTMQKSALSPNKRSGEIIFIQDTLSSLQRLGLGVVISAILGLSIGIPLGLLPLIRAGFSPFVAAFSMVPPIAILPILFIVFGMGEVAKVALIVIGVTPLIVRDLQHRVEEFSKEQLIKAQTLGANTLTLVIRIILPQMLPRLIDSVRLTLVTAWIFLISSEAIAATEGLGYRIFLVRRYLAMDMILPYVLWITLLAFLTDFLLKKLTQKLYPWYVNKERL